MRRVHREPLGVADPLDLLAEGYLRELLSLVEGKRTYISEAKYAGLVQNTVRPGDVLVGSFIDEEVRVCVFPRLPTPAIAKADCFCIRVRSSAVNSEYLAFQFATRRTHDSLVEEVHGATRPRISTKQLRKIKVRIPSLKEQEEIDRVTLRR